MRTVTTRRPAGKHTPSGAPAGGLRPGDPGHDRPVPTAAQRSPRDRAAVSSCSLRRLSARVHGACRGRLRAPRTPRRLAVAGTHAHPAAAPPARRRCAGVVPASLARTGRRELIALSPCREPVVPRTCALVSGPRASPRGPSACEARGPAGVPRPAGVLRKDGRVRPSRPVSCSGSSPSSVPGRCGPHRAPRRARGCASGPWGCRSGRRSPP